MQLKCTIVRTRLLKDCSFIGYKSNNNMQYVTIMSVLTTTRVFCLVPVHDRVHVLFDRVVFIKKKKKKFNLFKVLKTTNSTCKYRTEFKYYNTKIIVVSRVQIFDTHLQRVW